LQTNTWLLLSKMEPLPRLTPVTIF